MLIDLCIDVFVEIMLFMINIWLVSGVLIIMLFLS